MQRLERFIGNILRKDPVRSEPAEDPSEDLEFLLAPGKIEELVKEGRTPVQIGKIRSGNDEMQPYYLVPPRSYNPEGIDKVYVTAGGAIAFVYNDGSQHFGSTYTLTEEQAIQLEERVRQENERLQQKVTI